MSAPDDLAWAAGLFEGEGCVHIGRRPGKRYTSEIGRTVVAMVLVNTDEVLSRAFHQIVGAGTVNVRSFDERNGRKRQWTWQATSAANITSVIDILYPYMRGEKRAQMDRMREVIAAKAIRRAELAKQRTPPWIVAKR